MNQTKNTALYVIKAINTIDEFQINKNILHVKYLVNCFFEECKDISELINFRVLLGILNYKYYTRYSQMYDNEPFENKMTRLYLMLLLEKYQSFHVVYYDEKFTKYLSKVTELNCYISEVLTLSKVDELHNILIVTTHKIRSYKMERDGIIENLINDIKEKNTEKIELMKTLSSIYDYIFTEVQARLDAKRAMVTIEAQEKAKP